MYATSAGHSDQQASPSAYSARNPSARSIAAPRASSRSPFPTAPSQSRLPGAFAMLLTGMPRRPVTAAAALLAALATGGPARADDRPGPPPPPKEPAVAVTWPWLATQLLPSPELVYGDATARFGLRWQVTPLSSPGASTAACRRGGSSSPSPTCGSPAPSSST